MAEKDFDHELEELLNTEPTEMEACAADSQMKGDESSLGTKMAGYAGPEHAPFRCGACVHFDGLGSCDHPRVIADPEIVKTDKGLAIVNKNGCCNWFKDK